MLRNIGTHRTDAKTAAEAEHAATQHLGHANLAFTTCKVISGHEDSLLSVACDRSTSFNAFRIKSKDTHVPFPIEIANKYIALNYVL